MNHKLSPKQISAFSEYLHREERAAGTVEKYTRDINAFYRWAGKKNITKEAVAEWKNYLFEEKYAPVTINSMLAALNSFFKFMKWDDCQVKFLKLQRRMFRDASKELSREEYSKLLNTANAMGKKRLALLMETIFATGIRVSEVKYITIEAVQLGKAEISLKGKIRTILISSKLCRKLIKYARKNKIASGEIFLTKNGTSLSRCQIWAEMKRLCAHAGVEATKIFPHNLRHLFATSFYRVYKDIARLADVLGHSSIETTRTYLLTPGNEHRKQIELLGLVS